MTLEFLTVQVHGSLTTITLSRPEVLNALHSPAHFELAAVFDEFAADPSQHVAVLTGAGDRAFCAGNDLKFQASGGVMDRPLSGFGGLAARFDLDKPVIAAVNGLAMGGGFEIALACDLIVAADHALFGLPEPRVGLAALSGGLVRLPRQIGEKQAMSMILTGRKVTAAEGHAMGFVNEVVAPAALIGCARRWAEMILECSPMSIMASKQAVRRTLEEPSIGAAMANHRHYPAVERMFASADFIEGPQAFAQKRRPVWGRTRS